MTDKTPKPGRSMMGGMKPFDLTSMQAQQVSTTREESMGRLRDRILAKKAEADQDSSGPSGPSGP